MTVDVLNRGAASAANASRLAIADCDIHPRTPGAGSIGGISKALFPYMTKRWQEHIAEFGVSYRQQWEKGSAYPKAQPMACRRDAWPEGGTPGSDLTFMAEQHLDPNNVALGILNPLGAGQGAQNPDLSAAITHATNHWQKAEWTSKDSRLKGSVVVPYEDGYASAKEIELWAGDRDFRQVLLLSRTGEPLGQRRYWPIYEAAQAANLPVGIHAFQKLRQMKPIRQLEVAELMVSANNYSASYARALLMTTKPADLVKPESKVKAGLNGEQIEKLERELAAVSHDYRELETSFGDDTLVLVIAAGFLERILGRPTIEAYLTDAHPEMLQTFRSVVAAASLDQTAQAA